MIWRGFKYEYLVIDLAGQSPSESQTLLNQAGQEGWELIGVSLLSAYMTRLIVEVEEAKRPSPPPPGPPRKREER